MNAMSSLVCPFRSMTSRSNKTCKTSCVYFNGGCSIEPYRKQGGNICPMTDGNTCDKECAFHETCTLKLTEKARKKGIQDAEHPR